MNNQSANINTLWGSLIIEELVRNGVDHFVVAPGSRSTPLTVAVAENKQAKAILSVDERGAGFCALGLARGSGKPAAVITTSGTAVANLLPAVVEAFIDHLPLIILSADRSWELRWTGANQTIDQMSLFGEYLRWKFDLPAPDDRVSVTSVLTTVDQIWAKAMGAKGPVQLNCTFRKPLEPSQLKWDSSCLEGSERWQKTTDPYTQYTLSEETLTENDVKTFINLIDSTKKGLIIAGALKTNKDRQAISNLAERLQWPIYCDIISGMKLGYDHPSHIHRLDHILLSDRLVATLDVDTILQFGGHLTMKRLPAFIKQKRPERVCLVDDHWDRYDSDHLVTHRYTVSPSRLVAQIKNIPLGTRKTSNLQSWVKWNKEVGQTIDVFLQSSNDLNEPRVAHLVSQLTLQGFALFTASSMPVRDLDMYATTEGTSLEVGANRGASGIDGTLASAVGFSTGLGKPTVLLIGDLAFIHDMNSLNMVKELPYPLIIVLINNRGGGIFHFLPIVEHEAVFSPYFDTPHDIDFSKIAEAFSIDYHRPGDCDDFQRQYQQVLKKGKTVIIEIRTDRCKNREIHARIQSEVKNRIADLFS